MSGQNQKAKQWTNPETLKRNKMTQKQLHISHESQGMKRIGNIQHVKSSKGE